MIVLPEAVRTARLVLRPPRASDAATIFSGYAADPDVTRWLLWTPHRSVADTKAFLGTCREAWKRGTSFPWVITMPPDDEAIGMLEARPRAHAVEVGYVLRRADWGRGVMTEALRAVADLALASPEAFRVWATCDVDNAASGRVLEKAGFEFEGRLRRWAIHPGVSPEPRDVLCYSRTR